MAEREEPTLILSQLRDGDSSAAERLLPVVYEELRALADRYFRRERADHTLQPTAVVHEAFVRMIHQENASWKDRAHFFAVAATAMRQILTDHARRHGAAKRGGGAQLRIGVGNAPLRYSNLLARSAIDTDLPFVANQIGATGTAMLQLGVTVGAIDPIFFGGHTATGTGDGLFNLTQQRFFFQCPFIRFG